jgi:hypothetical protein
MKKLVIKYNPNCTHLLNYAVECIEEFKNDYIQDQKLGIINGVLWIIKNKENKREFQIYVYHTKTQIVCDIR